MTHEILYNEKYGSEAVNNISVKSLDVKSQYVIISNSASYPLLTKIKTFFEDVFLPQGYPDSVSKDYWDYQVWDSIQAFCSTLAGTLTTQAVLKGVGVGSTEATPFSAAITWTLKDGTGMIGRILFAWKKGTSLDADCKKWRLFADFLNDSAMLVEMFLLPLLSSYSTLVLCVSTTLKSIVGVAGGATKASTTQHQAIRNNVGDVLAKDGSQETCLNLIGSIFGIFLLAMVTDSDFLTNVIFLICLVMHMYSNYRAVRALNFETLNKERFLITLSNYLCCTNLLSREKVNNLESVVLGLGIKDKKICGFRVEVASRSITDLINSKCIKGEEFDLFLKFNKKLNRPYIIVVNDCKKTLHVLLKPDHSGKDILKAYFHSVVLGILISIQHNTPLENIDGRLTAAYSLFDEMLQTEKRLPDMCLPGDTEVLNKDNTLDLQWRKIPIDELLVAESVVKSKFDEFVNALKTCDWTVDQHNLPVGEWRGSWGPAVKLKSST